MGNKQKQGKRKALGLGLGLGLGIPAVTAAACGVAFEVTKDKVFELTVDTSAIKTEVLANTTEEKYPLKAKYGIKDATIASVSDINYSTTGIVTAVWYPSTNELGITPVANKYGSSNVSFTVTDTDNHQTVVSTSMINVNAKIELKVDTSMIDTDRTTINSGTDWKDYTLSAKYGNNVATIANVTNITYGDTTTTTPKVVQAKWDNNKFSITPLVGVVDQKIHLEFDATDAEGHTAHVVTADINVNGIIQLDVDTSMIETDVLSNSVKQSYALTAKAGEKTATITGISTPTYTTSGVVTASWDASNKKLEITPVADVYARSTKIKFTVTATCDNKTYTDDVTTGEITVHAVIPLIVDTSGIDAEFKLKDTGPQETSSYTLNAKYGSKDATISSVTNITYGTSGILTASWNNNKLDITPVAAGSTTISFKASDGTHEAEVSTQTIYVLNNENQLRVDTSAVATQFTAGQTYSPYTLTAKYYGNQAATITSIAVESGYDTSLITVAPETSPNVNQITITPNNNAKYGSTQVELTVTDDEGHSTKVKTQTIHVIDGQTQQLNVGLGNIQTTILPDGQAHKFTISAYLGNSPTTVNKVTAESSDTAILTAAGATTTTDNLTITPNKVGKANVTITVEDDGGNKGKVVVPFEVDYNAMTLDVSSIPTRLDQGISSPTDYQITAQYAGTSTAATVAMVDDPTVSPTGLITMSGASSGDTVTISATDSNKGLATVKITAYDNTDKTIAHKGSAIVTINVRTFVDGNYLVKTNGETFVLGDEINPNIFVGSSGDSYTIPTTSGNITVAQSEIMYLSLQSCDSSISDISSGEFSKGFLAFCSNLIYLDISGLNNITGIGYAFLRGCSSLKSVDLSPLSKIIRIPSAFCYDCTSLEYIDLSPLTNVTQIGQQVLYNTNSLKGINFNGLSKLSRIDNDFCKIISGNANLKSVDMSFCTKVSLIEAGFFNGQKSLVNIKLPYMVQNSQISSYFLSRCTSLESIDLTPLSNITSIGSAFMYGCSNLKSIDLSCLTKLTQTSHWFLINCNNLTTINIGNLSADIFEKSATAYTGASFSIEDKTGDAWSIGVTLNGNDTEIASLIEKFPKSTSSSPYRNWTNA